MCYFRSTSKIKLYLTCVILGQPQGGHTTVVVQNGGGGGGRGGDGDFATGMYTCVKGKYCCWWID